MTDAPRRTRRRVLKLSAGALGAAVLAGCTGPAGGGDDGGGGDSGGGGDGGDQPAPRGEETPGAATTEDEQSPTADDTVTEEAETGTTDGSTNETGTGTAEGGENRIRLGARTDGWVGRAPDSIADQQNPNLSLVEGETYELIWENLDGNEHQLLIEDQSQTVLYTTDRASDQGSQQRITFEAREAMSTYYCRNHSSQMRGQVLMEGESAADTPSG
ncbi:hypothetical protein [Haloprofundus salinisoli]|uniref:hypothetical protein n=1 Tax=Haloprofundus salinisoli TaxID=2876193 RepID=UPI001CCB8F14|nr:hypothetical protein [Haloprofundus salinisoli]